jgi:hypothetical protein
LIGVLLFCFVAILFFIEFQPQNLDNKALFEGYKSKSTSNVTYSVILPEFSISVNAPKKLDSIEGVKFVGAYVFIGKDNYRYLEGNAKGVVIKGNKIVIKGFNGNTCNAKGNLMAQKLTINVTTGTLKIAKFSLLRSDRLIWKSERNRNVSLDKMCRFLEGKTKKPF